MTLLTPTLSPRAAATPTPVLDVIQLHQQAESALSMALYYVRQPARNLPGAARKAVQALDALNRLKIGGLASAGNDGGRV